MSLFKPKEIIDRFDKFDINSLKKLGYKVIFIDIDNTITLPGIGELTIEAKEFIEKIKKIGLIPIIFSNNTKKRVKRFVGDYDIDWYYLSMKPLPFSFLYVCNKYKCKPSECIVLGDQLITDILGANLSGCYGIYTKQLSLKDTPLTKINRKFEKIIWRHMK